jgi:subtilisin-like proprotein convertase family protein
MKIRCVYLVLLGLPLLVSCTPETTRTAEAPEAPAPTEKKPEKKARPSREIPDNDSAGLTIPQTVAAHKGAAGAPRTLAAVRVELRIEHPRPSDLEVSLVHPDGTAVRLHNRKGVKANLAAAYPERTKPDQSLERFRGKPAAGIWKLQARDLKEGRTGKVAVWNMEVVYAP